MSFNQQFDWRLHVTSRPKLLVRSCAVVVAHSLPAGFDCPCASPLFMRLRSDQLGCGRPLCAGSFESFRLFARAPESSAGFIISRFSCKLEALHSVHHVHLHPLVQPSEAPRQSPLYVCRWDATLLAEHHCNGRHCSFSATLALSRSDPVSSRFLCLKKNHILPDVWSVKVLVIMVCRHYLLNMYLKNPTDVCLQGE